MDHSTLPGCAGAKGLPAPKGIPRFLRLLSGVKRRNSGTGHGPPKMQCPVWNAPGVICRAVQKLHRCLTLLVQQYNLLDLEMLDMARKDPMASPVPTVLASSLGPRVEEPIGIPNPDKPPALEPKKAVHSEELTLMQRRRPLVPPGFTLSWAYESSTPPLEDADWLVSLPLGDHLDLTSSGSLQVTVSHYPTMRKVWYQCQTWVIAQTSLQLTLSKPLDQPDSPLQMEELWVNTMLSMSNYTIPKPLDEL